MAYTTFVWSLRRQHRLLWLVLGVGFSVSLSSQLVQDGLARIGLTIGLLTAYSCAGRLAAGMVARSVARSVDSRLTTAILASSVKIGALLAFVSTLFHLVLLVALNGRAPLDLLAVLRGPILPRAAIFPFLACLGAACTVKSTAQPGSTGTVQYSTRLDLSV